MKPGDRVQLKMKLTDKPKFGTLGSSSNTDKNYIYVIFDGEYRERLVHLKYIIPHNSKDPVWTRLFNKLSRVNKLSFSSRIPDK